MNYDNSLVTDDIYLLKKHDHFEEKNHLNNKFCRHLKKH